MGVLIQSADAQQISLKSDVPLKTLYTVIYRLCLLYSSVRHQPPQVQGRVVREVPVPGVHHRGLRRRHPLHHHCRGRHLREAHGDQGLSYYGLSSLLVVLTAAFYSTHKTRLISHHCLRFFFFFVMSRPAEYDFQTKRRQYFCTSPCFRASSTQRFLLFFRGKIRKCRHFARL